MAEFNKTELMNKKKEYLELQAKYFDAMLEYNFYEAAEISKQTIALFPTSLILEFSLDVSTQIKLDKGFMKKMKEEYNEEARLEMLKSMFGPPIKED